MPEPGNEFCSCHADSVVLLVEYRYFINVCRVIHGNKQGFKAMFKRMLASRLAAGIAAALAALLLLVIVGLGIRSVVYLKVNRRNWDLKTLGNWPHKRPIVRR